MSSNPSYGDKDYWDKRYEIASNSTNQIYDWYKDYDSGLKDYINRRVSKSDSILVIGCGNSLLSEEMYLDGYSNITSIDYSRNAINIMSARAYSRGYDLKYLEMDARNLNFKDESIDVVLDKGTIDALMCGDDSSENCDQLAREAYRVLKPGGTMICISYGIPSSRIEVFDKPYFNWKIYKDRIEQHYVYRTVKN